MRPGEFRERLESLEEMLNGVLLETGADYRIYIESTGSSVGYYRIPLYASAKTGIVEQVLSAQFQGPDYFVTWSPNGTTWYQYLYATRESDAPFRLELDPVPIRGTVVVVK